MRIVSANVFCLNPRPASALRAVADQGGDVTVLIEATARVDRYARRLLPDRRASGLTRRGGMPVAVHAAEDVPVQNADSQGEGWVECEVNGLTLLAVHAIAPYLPWRLRRRRRQLAALGDRLASIGENEPALAVGDFNTSHFGRAWGRFARAAKDWRRLAPEVERWTGTWPLGNAWAPIALDHALIPPHLAGGDVAPAATARTFPIPGSDHLGLVVDLPRTVAGVEPEPLHLAAG